MFKKAATLALLFLSLNVFSQTQTFHDFSAKTITGQNLDFSTLRGKKVMVVNTASFCSWTPQYEQLQNLYDQYKDSNFVILGFPCNDFNGQEPETDSTILDFCIDVYSINFQMMSKIEIVSTDTAEVYKWLQRADMNGVKNASVTWNFNKFLIDEAGGWVAHYTQFTDPFDPAIVNWILSASVLPPDTATTSISTLAEIKLKITNHDPGNITVSFENGSSQKIVIDLFSMSGQLLGKIHDGIIQDGERINIDVSAYENSLYFLQVRDEKQSRVFKVAVVN